MRKYRGYSERKGLKRIKEKIKSGENHIFVHKLSSMNILKYNV